MNAETRTFEVIGEAEVDTSKSQMPVFEIGQKFCIGEVEFQIDNVRRRSLVVTPTDKTWEGLLNKPSTLK